MILAAPYIRKAFFALLNNAIQYDGVTIPVYDAFNNDAAVGSFGSYQITLEEQSSSEQNNKHAFNSNWNQNIEAICEMKGSGVRKHSDAIAQSIILLATPSPRTTGLIMAAPLQLTDVRVRAINHLTEETETSFIGRTIITFSLSVHQQ